jgi:regulator of microtubule dynamics protein 3
MKDKIASAFKVKEFCDRANQLLPLSPDGTPLKDGTLQHLLGRWCFRIASVSWIERKLAKAIIAELPDSRKLSFS